MDFSAARMEAACSAAGGSGNFFSIAFSEEAVLLLETTLLLGSEALSFEPPILNMIDLKSTDFALV
jgi:hypothetical protein